MLLGDDESNHETDEALPRLSVFVGASNQATKAISFEIGTAKSFINALELDDIGIDYFNSNVFYSDHLEIYAYHLMNQIRSQCVKVGAFTKLEMR